MPSATLPLLVLLALVACDGKRANPTKKHTMTPSAAEESPLAFPKEPSPPRPSALPVEQRENSIPAVSTSTWFVADGLVDVGPAGPAAATPRGVALISRDGGLHLAPLRNSPSRDCREHPTPLTGIDAEPQQFVALEHGPEYFDGHLYYVTEGHLVRRPLGTGDLEILARDARSFTRVAVPEKRILGWPPLAAYVARGSDTDSLTARLWIEGQPGLALTPDGSTANSVSLARLGSRLVAVSLESRTGMSPIHVRNIEFSGGRLALTADRVAWVAGTAQPLTEIFAQGHGHEGWGLLAIERDASRFGLVTFPLTRDQVAEEDSRWHIYPNGLSPAVVTTGVLCNKPVAIYAQPTTERPHAPQALELVALGDTHAEPPVTLATSRAFADVSLEGLDGGALLVYVADRRTWARRLRCVEACPKKN